MALCPFRGDESETSPRGSFQLSQDRSHGHLPPTLDVAVVFPVREIDPPSKRTERPAALDGDFSGAPASDLGGPRGPQARRSENGWAKGTAKEDQ
jgi:hypothetical protein